MIRLNYKLLLRYTKVMFYIRNFCGYIIPNVIHNKLFLRKLNKLTEEEQLVARERANYYIRLSEKAHLDKDQSVQVRDFKYPFGQKHKFSAYFFDLYESIRCFNPKFRFHYIFGDIDYEAKLPTFVKSRPIVQGCTNSVVCRLNKVRHFRFLHDTNRFQEKKDQLVFRNIVRKQPQRTKFIESFIGHPMCDVGQVNNDSYTTRQEFVKPYLSIEEQLKYKFIACIEGHDVATNLKWVMSSNSLAVMPRPKIESWFMEGRLIGGYHYVEIKEDYSDLIEKLNYYISHPGEAEAIIKHAHEYVNQFCNERLEQAVQYQVIRRYFEIMNTH